MNDLQVYEAQNVVAKANKGGYDIIANGVTTHLKRDVDFGVIPGTKKPTLYKAGAEKIARDLGLLQHYTLVNAIEDPEKPLFFYTVKCELVKVANTGQEYVFYSSYGSANTLEKRCGRASAFDTANSCIKQAQVRSLRSAVVSAGSLSDIFTMDIEDELFMQGYSKIANSQDPESIISAPQIKRLYAIAYEAGYNAKQAKEVLAKNGVMDTKAIKQKDYDAVCKLFEVG